MKQVFNSMKAPEAIGPYSQSVKVDDTLYLSGQLGVSRETGKLKGDTIEEQAEQVFKNIGYILHGAGLQYDDIFKVMVYLTDMDDFAAVNNIYKDYFNPPYPVRTALGVKALPIPGAKIEIDVVAKM